MVKLIVKAYKKIMFKVFPKKNIRAMISISAPNNELKDEVILVTGGGSGIGKAIAKYIIGQGGYAIIVGRREKNLKETCEELGSKCNYFVTDLTKIENYEMFWKDIEGKFNKKITSIVCNAGIYIDMLPLDFETYDFEKCYMINTIAPAKMIQTYINYSINNKIESRIVVTASNRALFGDYGPYGMSKSAIINYVQGMAKKFCMSGIRINAVAPGMTASEINNLSRDSNLYTKSAIGERVLIPEEIAEVVGFLLNPKSRCINGVVIPCDEGDFLR